MVSPALCPTSIIALKSKFFPLPMVIAAGIGQMMINCASWRRALSATDKRQPQLDGMAFCRSLLTTWRRQYRNGELGSFRPVPFAPVTVQRELPRRRQVRLIPVRLRTVRLR